MESSKLRVWAVGAALSLLTALAYSGSLQGAFVFDDPPSISENPTIRHLWPPGTIFAPPANGITVTGRPVLNLSFALNYAGGGNAVRGYHLANICIHLLAALTLFGILRRTLSGPELKQRYGEAALPLAGLVALLWALHPVQTEAVTYVVQRAESLASLFYLATLYAFIVAVGTSGARRWLAFAGAVVGCCLGTGTKEILVTAPVLILLYDRTFIAGSFKEAWRRRGRFHLALASSWLVQAWWLHASFDRGGTIGFNLGIARWTFALMQCQAVVHYFSLSLWPHPLIFDYGFPWNPSLLEAVPAVAAMAGLLGATLLALWRWPRAGFAGAWFFGILAPTSLVPGAVQIIVEHRLYLPLAGLLALAAAGLYGALNRGSFVVLAAAAIALGGLTFQRNRDYRSETYLWRDTAAKRPENARAHNNLGQSLLQGGQWDAAIAPLETAVRLRPDYAKAHNNLGVALAQSGQDAAAIGHYETALRLDPNDGEIQHNLGDALLRGGHLPEAMAHYDAALQTRPELADLQENNLGRVLLDRGQINEAIGYLESALRRRPDFAEAHNNLGNALAQAGRLAEAVEHYNASLKLRPDDATTHFNLGNARLEMKQLPDAIEQYEAALKLNPRLTGAYNNLGTVWLLMGKKAEAMDQFNAALRVDPGYPPARENLDKLKSTTP